MLNPDQALRGKYVNVDAINKAIGEGPYDAVIVNSPESVPYYSGFYNMDLRLIPERFHFVVWPRDAEPAFVVVQRRADTLLPGETFLTDIVPYQGEGLDSIRAITDVLKDRGITSGKIGIEGRHFPGGHLQALQGNLPNVQFEDAFALIESPRLIKTPAEIETLELLASWTTDAIDTAFAAAKPGDTEKSLMARMQYELLKNGADMIAAPTFGSGERSGLFHGIATNKKLEQGDLIKTDFGGYFDGYYSDVARTAVIGKATDEQKDMHKKVSDIKDAIVDYIKPGMAASEVANFGRKAYADRGLEFKWAIIGHSIGLGIHEEPQIYPWVDEPILPGMAMMIELGYHNYPNDTYHVEDLIVVTDKGAEYRSDFSKHKTLWEIGE